MDERVNDDFGGSPLQPETWFPNYGNYLYKYALSKTNDPELARDLVQDTFLAALEKSYRFEYRSSERTWLRAILHYKICRVYRTKKQNPLTVASNMDESIELHLSVFNHSILQSHEYLKDDPLIDKEFREMFHHNLNNMPLAHKMVVQLKYIENLSTGEICQHLNLSRSNFWVICHRIKTSLKDCMDMCR